VKRRGFLSGGLLASLLAWLGLSRPATPEELPTHWVEGMGHPHYHPTLCCPTCGTRFIVLRGFWTTSSGPYLCYRCCNYQYVLFDKVAGQRVGGGLVKMINIHDAIGGTRKLGGA
jgi:hypothetical protein